MDGNSNTPSRRILREGVEKPTPSVYNINQSHGTVAVRSAFPAIVERTGQVTGKQYRWNYAGQVIEVDERDLEQLLTLRVGGNGCCGNLSGGFAMFEKV